MTTDPLVSDSTALISDDGRYRYLLTRRWADGPSVAWIMLNPSTADAHQDDPTIRRCIGFAKAWGYAAIEVVNLYAFRATNPVDLIDAWDPEGPENWRWVSSTIKRHSVAVAAWGASVEKIARHHPTFVLPRPLWCLGLTKGDHPRHPLYVPSSQRLVRFD